MPNPTSPLDPAMAEALQRLDPDANEYFQERAAIRQHMGGLSQLEAERAAFQETLIYIESRNARRNPRKLT